LAHPFLLADDVVLTLSIYSTTCITAKQHDFNCGMSSLINIIKKLCN